MVGLYSAYSRSLHYALRAIFRWTGLVHHWLEPHFRKVTAQGKRDAWFRDQYCHPHESCHTLDEILGWLDADRLEFVNSIPKPIVGPVLTPDEQLFAPRSAGRPLQRMFSQLADTDRGYREGGFFVVVARRKEGGC